MDNLFKISVLLLSYRWEQKVAKLERNVWVAQADRLLLPLRLAASNMRVYPLLDGRNLTIYQFLYNIDIILWNFKFFKHIKDMHFSGFIESWACVDKILEQDDDVKKLLGWDCETLPACYKHRHP